jgi:hypothetical protein
MVIRVFQYGYNYGVWAKKREGNIRVVELPEARVINLTGTADTPSTEKMMLTQNGKVICEYEVENFNLLAHSVSDLEDRGLVILIPFYILKLQDRVKNAAAGAERKKVFAEMRGLLDSLLETVDNCMQKGKIDGQDMIEIIREMEKLNDQLFENYDEFFEEDGMKENYRRYSTMVFEQRDLKIAEKLAMRGVSADDIAQATELPFRKVKALLKKMEKSNQLFEPTREIVERTTKLVTKRVTERVTEQNRLEIAKKLLADGLLPERVAKNTDLPLERVKALQKQVTNDKC